MSDTTAPIEFTYVVSGISCGHCVNAITAEVMKVAGVAELDVDIDRKLVKVTGVGLDEAALRNAIDEAGYEIDG